MELLFKAIFSLWNFAIANADSTGLIFVCVG